MSTSSTKEIGSEQLKWAQKNQGFNAVIFVWRSFLAMIYHFDGKEKVEAFDKLFKPVYDEIFKEFLPDFYGNNSNSEDKSAS